MTTQEGNVQTGNVTQKIAEIISENNKKGEEMLKINKQNWFSRNVGNVVPVKLLAGLALGGLLMVGLAGPLSADTPSAGPEGRTIANSIPASAAYQAFPLWEFPNTHGAVNIGSPSLSSVSASDDYQAFSLWEFPDMNGAVNIGSPSFSSISASDDYQAFSLWEFPNS